ncbi:MAG TPA: PAS domain S-box protein, partial [Flavisolibacter sp.]|nr:PAS domain S-box protein [Flavisolibacter sp.]
MSLSALVKTSIDFQVFQAMPGNSIVLLPDIPVFTIVAATDDYHTTLGRTKEELINIGFFDAFPAPADDPEQIGVKQLRASLEKVIQQKTPDRTALVRYDIENEDGTFDEPYWSAVNKPVIGENGEVLYIIHTAEEITAQVKAEQSANRIKSLEKSYDLFMQAPVTIGVVKGPEYIIELANDSLLEVWGRTAEVVDTPLFEAIPELNGQGYKALLDQVCQTGEPFYTYEHPIRLNRHGKEDVLYFDFVYKPYYEDGQAKPVGVLAVGYDVTKQVESRQKFKSVIEEAKSPILILMGEDMVLDTANQALFDLWQVGPEALGKPFLEILPEMKEQGFPDLLKNVLHTGKPFYGKEVPTVFKRKTGVEETVCFDFSYQPYRNAEGTIAGVLVMATDVSSQVQARKKIEESESRFRLMADTVPAIIRITEKDRLCSYLNKRWYNATGQTEDGALGFGWLAAVHPKDSERSGKIFMDANDKGEAFHVLYRLRQNDGTYRWSIDSGEPRFDANGNFAGYIGSVVDVHEQMLLEENMRRSEERYRHLFQNSPVAKWDEDFTAVKKRLEDLLNAGVTDFQSYFNQHTNELLGLVNSVIINDLNEAALRMWGGSKEELLSGLQQFFIEDTLQTFIEEIAIIGAGGGRFETETTVQSKTGEKINVLVRIDFPKGEDYSSVPVILVNITERKKAEEALKESENRFRTLAEALPQMVWMRNNKGIIEYGSKHWEDYSGIRGVSEAWRSMVHPEDWKEVMHAWESDSAKGRPYRYEVRLKNKEGEYRWHYASGEPIKDNDGNVIKWIGALTDIHAQKTFAEQLETEVAERTRELKNSESFLQQLIDSSVEFITVIDKDLRFVTVNKSVEKLMRTSRKELKNTFLFDFHPKLKDTIYHDAIMQCLKGETIHLEKSNSVAEPERYIDSYFIPYIVEGKAEGVILMARDITTIVQTEKKLERVVKELERSNDDLQQFAHVVSHDLKEPVRKVVTFSHRLRDELGEEISDNAALYFSKIESASMRMYAMIDGVLLYSSMNALEQTKEVIDLNKTIQNIEADLEVVIQQKSACLQYDNLPAIEGSAVLIYQLLYNLINNSLKFAKSDQRPLVEISAKKINVEEIVSLGLSKGREYVKVSVSDNGIGFAQSNAEKIFQTFTRLNAKDKY